MAGMAGLEPTISESKSGVLPLHYIPLLCSKRPAQPASPISIWGGIWGSNPRHPEPQSGALPTELIPPYIYSYMTRMKAQLSGFHVARKKDLDRRVRPCLRGLTVLKVLLSERESNPYRFLQADFPQYFVKCLGNINGYYLRPLPRLEKNLLCKNYDVPVGKIILIDFFFLSCRWADAHQNE